MPYYSETQRCIISGQAGVDLHHVKTRGSGGTDAIWNLMPLGHIFHQEIHQIGLSTFAEKYGQAKYWLNINGWEYDPIRRRWLHP